MPLLLFIVTAISTSLLFHNFNLLLNPDKVPVHSFHLLVPLQWINFGFYNLVLFGSLKLVVIQVWIEEVYFGFFGFGYQGE